MVGKYDLSQEVATAARWGRETLPRYFNGSVWGIRFRTPLYSGCPGELSTSADSCQHCRTLSENRTAIAVYRRVAKRDTLSVELTGQHGAVTSTTPQKASVSDTPKQGIETGFLSAYKARNAMRR